MTGFNLVWFHQAKMILQYKSDGITMEKYEETRVFFYLSAKSAII